MGIATTEPKDSNIGFEWQWLIVLNSLSVEDITISFHRMKMVPFISPLQLLFLMEKILKEKI